MGVNKIQLSNGEVLVDMSQVSVTPETLAKGETALDASGELIIGTMESGGSSGGEDEIVNDPAGMIEDDGEGNITIDPFHSYTFSDDGEGNLTGEIAEALTATDDGNGNVSFV